MTKEKPGKCRVIRLDKARAKRAQAQLVQRLGVKAKGATQRAWERVEAASRAMVDLADTEMLAMDALKEDDVHTMALAFLLMAIEDRETTRSTFESVHETNHARRKT